MKLEMKLFAISIGLMLVFLNGSIYEDEDVVTIEDDLVTIEVAVYDVIIEDPGVDTLLMLDGFQWSVGGKTYRFNLTTIYFWNVISGDLTKENYDALVISGTPLDFFHAVIPMWREEIKKFVCNGGGYIGICAAAAIATHGPFPGEPFVKPLAIANLYSDLDSRDEGQYYFQHSRDGIGKGIPVIINISQNPIFTGGNRSIRYWSGPGMYDADDTDMQDPRYGDIVVVATYAEEPSDVAPIHRQLIFGGKRVKTSLKGKYAVIATTYDRGRIVLFGPHPEINTWVNVTGNPEENIEEGWNGWKWYEWIGGDETSRNYNLWMVKKSLQWASRVPMNTKRNQ